MDSTRTRWGARKRGGSIGLQQSAALASELSFAERLKPEGTADRSSRPRLTSRRSPVRARHRPSSRVRFRSETSAIGATKSISPAVLWKRGGSPHHDGGERRTPSGAATASLCVPCPNSAGVGLLKCSLDRATRVAKSHAPNHSRTAAISEARGLAARSRQFACTWGLQDAELVAATHVGRLSRASKRGTGASSAGALLDSRRDPRRAAWARRRRPRRLGCGRSQHVTGVSRGVECRWPPRSQSRCLLCRR